MNLKLPGNIASTLQTGATVEFSVVGTGSIGIIPIGRATFDYLSVPNYAASLFNARIYKISATRTEQIPLTHLFPNSGAGDKSLGFLFEGVDSGSITLKGIIRDHTGAFVTQTEEFHAVFQPITNFYDHFTVGDTSDTGAPVSPVPIREAIAQTYSANPATSNAVFSALTTPLVLDQTLGGASDPNGPYILFVHGWRVEPWERRRFAETAVKRLYWAGYRGGVGLFSWPTEWLDIELIANWPLSSPNFCRSNVQAWKAAAGLRTLLNALENGNQSRVRVLAHSMGNFAASEALRLGLENPLLNKRIYSYIASQSATPASAYNPVLANRNVAQWVDLFGQWTVTDSYFANIKLMTSDGTLGGSGVVNLYNESDFALYYEELDWELPLSDSSGYSRDYLLGRYYRELPGDPAGGYDFNLALKEDRYEVFSHFVPAAGTKPLGVSSTIGGDITSAVDLRQPPYNFTGSEDDHSAQFNSTIHYRFNYWRFLLGFTAIAAMPPDPNTVSPQNFQQWGSAWFGFPAAVYQPLDSFAGDGVVNLTKYAFGLNPLQKTGYPQVEASISGVVSSQIELEFWRPALALDLTFAVEWSADMGVWVSRQATFTTISTNGPLNRVRASVVNSGSPTGFYRIKASLVP